jgi:hypothetical protein
MTAEGNQMIGQWTKTPGDIWEEWNIRELRFATLEVMIHFSSSD